MKQNKGTVMEAEQGDSDGGKGAVLPRVTR